MQTISVALLGYGYSGKTFHAPLIASTTGLRLAAVCSGNATKVKADWPEVFVSADIGEVLKYPDISLVVIATPNDTHYDLAHRALLAGKNIVVDKPFTVTENEARQLQTLATRLGLLLSIFQNRRWDADFLTLRSLLRDGRLGKVNYLESRIDRFRPVVRDRWREKNESGGGLWYDLGPHLIDQVVQLFGSPLTLESSLEIQRHGAKTVDFFRVRFIYPELQVVLQGSMLSVDNGPRFIVQGSKGCYIKHGMDPQEAALKNGDRPPYSGWGKDGCDGELWLEHAEELQRTTLTTIPGDYSQYYRAIRDALLNGLPNPVTAEEGVEIMRLLEVAVKQSTSNRAFASCTSLAMF